MANEKDTDQEKPAEVTIEDKIAAGIQKWVDEHLRNNDFSRDTLAWNVLQGALPHLPGAITEELK